MSGELRVILLVVAILMLVQGLRMAATIIVPHVSRVSPEIGQLATFIAH